MRLGGRRRGGRGQRHERGACERRDECAARRCVVRSCVRFTLAAGVAGCQVLPGLVRACRDRPAAGRGWRASPPRGWTLRMTCTAPVPGSRPPSTPRVVALHWAWRKTREGWGGWTEGVRCVATTLAVGSDQTPVTPGQARVAGTMRGVPAKVLLAAPRGYCAGVDRAVEAVERALQTTAPPSTCASRSSTTCTSSATSRPRARSSSTRRPRSRRAAVVVLSAHGVAPEVYANAERRGSRCSTRPARS